MKSKRLVISIGVGMLATAVIAACGLFGSREPEPFFHRGLGPRFQGKDFSRQVLTRLDDHVKTLNLNEAQKRKYGELRAQIEADMAAMKERRKVFLESVRKEIDRENPDLDAVASRIKERLDEVPRRIGAHLDAFLEFYLRGKSC